MNNHYARMTARMHSSLWLKIYEAWADSKLSNSKPLFCRAMGLVKADRVSHAQFHRDFSGLVPQRRDAVTGEKK